MPLLPPPPHEQRERWMTAISASFTNATIWRYARDMFAQTTELRNGLELGINKLTRMLDEFWLMPRIVSFWKQIARSVTKICHGWQSILDWIEQRKWRDPAYRDEKQQVIKTLAVLNHHTSIYLHLYEEAFESVFECFRRHARVTTSKRPPRRWSTANQHLYARRVFQNRCYYERMLHLYAQRIETSLAKSQQATHKHYNSSKLFEDFVTDVQQNNKKQEEWWTAWGKKYPWPSCQLKNLGGKDSELWQQNAPLNGVLSWEEDERLREMFA